MAQRRHNVRQHVVPQVYLEQYADAAGSLQVQHAASGGVFAGRPIDLCVEKDVYTLLDDGKRDDSCDKINQDVENAIGGLYQRLKTGVDLEHEATQRDVFTTFAVFTANLIARSRVLRNHFSDSLNAVISFLSGHPDSLVDFPEDDYQRFLLNPDALKGDSKTAQVLRKFGTILRDCDSATDEPFTVSTTAEALRQLTKIHYPVLLKARTAILPDVMQNAGVKADLLVPECDRFISADDPVIFVIDGELATNLSPADIQVWAAPNRSVYLPLSPYLAVHWTVTSTFSKRTISAAEVQNVNQLLAQHAIRHRFAREASDFPN